MIAVLNDGREVYINKYNCGYQFYTEDGFFYRMWNIDVIEVVNDGIGFLVIAKWGSKEEDECQEMIPVRNIVSLKEINDWEEDKNSLGTALYQEF